MQEPTTSTPTSDAPVAMDDVVTVLSDTVLAVWTDFIAHLPLLAAGLCVVAATWALAWTVERYAMRALRRWRGRESLRSLVTRLLAIGVWMLGLLLAAMVMFPGLTPTRALGGLGLLSVAVGFAFRDIFENFFAGVLILWKFPFENGDFIECQGLHGRVEDVTIRMTSIRKTTGELVVLPNSLLFKNPVEILTNEPKRRVTVMTGIAYDVDVTEAVTIIQQALQRCDTVDQERSVDVFPQAFGSSSIDIEVTWWTDPEPRDIRRSRAEVVTVIKRALDEAGLEIPFPYRTLTFKEPLPVHAVGNLDLPKAG